MAPLTKAKVPYTGPYSIAGNGKHKGNTALALKRAMSRLGHMPWEPEKWDNAFNAKLEAALDKWYPGKDGYGPDRYDRIRAAKTKSGEPALDGPAITLIQNEAKVIKVAVPALGPVYWGGRSILDQDLTHATSGISLFPAFDDAFSSGTGIIAPENMTVYKASSAKPGDACYCKGNSKIRYWFGHLVSAPAVGRSFKKGDLIGRVARTNVGGGSHVHIGVNVELLWGVGKQLAHHTDYTHGAPIIRAQLEAFKLV